MPATPMVKICGLQHREDAELAADLGAAYLGVIASAGFGRSLRTRDAAALLDGLRATKVAVFVDEELERATAAASEIGASVVQLHGTESPEYAAEVTAAGFEVWKAVRAKSVGDVERVVHGYSQCVAGFLVEGWLEGVAGGGGARLTVEPSGVRQTIPEASKFILAGGLTPENVARSAARFMPDVVDVSSGVERVTGRKDRDLLRRFFDAVHNAPLPTEQ